MIAALTLGIVGTLVLGFGMSLCLSELGALLGITKTVALIAGIVSGVVGAVLASFAYPVYNAIVKARRKKLALEIMRLTHELLK